VTCGCLITRKGNNCKRPFCQTFRKNREIGHFCYMNPLQDVLPSSDNVLYVFYDFETTQDTKYSEKARSMFQI
jgi:hypothetical protein